MKPIYVNVRDNEIIGWWDDEKNEVHDYKDLEHYYDCWYLRKLVRRVILGLEVVVGLGKSDLNNRSGIEVLLIAGGGCWGRIDLKVLLAKINIGIIVECYLQIAVLSIIVNCLNGYWYPALQ